MAADVPAGTPALCVAMSTSRCERSPIAAAPLGLLAARPNRTLGTPCNGRNRPRGRNRPSLSHSQPDRWEANPAKAVICLLSRFGFLLFLPGTLAFYRFAFA